jgi:hypothetical protein
MSGEACQAGDVTGNVAFGVLLGLPAMVLVPWVYLERDSSLAALSLLGTVVVAALLVWRRPSTGLGMTVTLLFPAVVLAGLIAISFATSTS